MLPANARSGARFVALLFCAFSFLLPCALEAQTPTPVDSLIVPGARMRLELAGPPHSFEGRLRELRGDTLVLERSGVRSSIPAADVSRALVLRRSPALSRNVTIGGVAGMLGGAGLYLSWCANNRADCRRDNQSADDDDDESELTLGIVSVLGGALLGGVVGYVLTPVEWVEANAPLRIGATRSGGIRISGSLAFR